jgi:hypothetical protein
MDPANGAGGVLRGRADHQQQPPWREIMRLLLRGALVLLLCWLCLAGIHYSLPYIRPGSEVVSKAKQQVIASGTLFDKRAAVRIAFFGNSKVLAGFDPRLFDTLAGPGVNSYNLGIPNDLVHVRNLELMCQRGEAPTLVLLIYPWTPPSVKPVDVFRPNIDDSDWMDSLFPFRNLPRNAVLFALRARTRGGLGAYYRAGLEQVERMVENRGYYFIEGQSHSANDRLPDVFHLQTDTPGTASLRKPVIAASEFDRLRRLAEEYDLRVLFVPPYYRQGEFAAPSNENARLRAGFAPYPRFGVTGPDYYLLPNRFFSDPAHLNREGADWYTRELWQLLEPVLRGQPAREAGPEAGVRPKESSPRRD